MSAAGSRSGRVLKSQKIRMTEDLENGLNTSDGYGNVCWR